MDFSDLMNIAATKQQVTEKKVKSKKSKGNESQVSSEAVKAFLARQNAQKARQKEQEESAKRARIKARLQRELADKSKNKKKGDTSTTEKDVGNTAATDAGNKTRNLSRENDHHYSTTGSSVPPPKNKTKAGVKRSSKETKETKHVENKGRECRNNKPDVKSSDTRFDEKEKRKVPPKAMKPAAATLSFQELMNVAKKQVNNPDAMLKLTGNPRVKQEETKTEKVESKAATEERGKEVRIKCKTAVVAHTSPKTSKKAPAKQNTANVRKKKEPIQEDVCKRKAPSVVKEQTVRGAKPQKMTIERTTVSEKGNHYPADPARDHRKRPYDDHDDDDDDYEEEMDEFIDDSEATPDISSYIKEIFGYDRNKFRGKDDDVDDMESSFADIQREEAKSTRIAKLEDEIERLKETYELEGSEKKKIKK